MLGYAIGSLFLPAALALRFGIIAPLSWVFPGLRRLTIERFSALIINHQYVRRASMDRAAHLQEMAATAVVWGSILLWRAGVLPGAAFGSWYAVATFASLINVVRTLASHRYDHDVVAGPAGHLPSLTMTEQLLDTCTIRADGGIAGMLVASWREMWAPVGLRYHALHPWIPSLPYHNLGRAHRLLLSTLTPDAPYVTTQYPAIAAVVLDLVHRARRQSS